jgi:hypothetical protein
MQQAVNAALSPPVPDLITFEPNTFSLLRLILLRRKDI